MDRNDPQDGGPAFPVLMKAGDVAIAEGGMSLRDYFAGQALPYVAEFHGQDLYKDRGPRDIAAKAYEIADAMLAERAKTAA